MGHYFIGVRSGELSADGELTPKSVEQLFETAQYLREFKGGWLPKVVYSDGSIEGNATAELLADILEIERVEVKAAFNGRGGFRTTKRLFGLLKTKVPVTPVERMLRELTVLEFSISRINITVCSAELLHAYLTRAYQKFGKGRLATEERIGLRPGECVIAEQHDWEPGLKKIYPSRKQEDLLTSKLNYERQDEEGGKTLRLKLYLLSGSRNSRKAEELLKQSGLEFESETVSFLNVNRIEELALMGIDKLPVLEVDNVLFYHGLNEIEGFILAEAYPLSD